MHKLKVDQYERRLAKARVAQDLKMIKDLGELRSYLSETADDAEVNCDEMQPPNGRESFSPGELENLNGCRCIGCGGAYSNDQVIINTQGSVCWNCLYNMSELLLGHQRFAIK